MSEFGNMIKAVLSFIKVIYWDNGRLFNLKLRNKTAGILFICIVVIFVLFIDMTLQAYDLKKENTALAKGNTITTSSTSVNKTSEASKSGNVSKCTDRACLIDEELKSLGY